MIMDYSFFKKNETKHSQYDIHNFHNPVNVNDRSGSSKAGNICAVDQRQYVSTTGRQNDRGTPSPTRTPVEV